MGVIETTCKLLVKAIYRLICRVYPLPLPHPGQVEFQSSFVPRLHNPLMFTGISDWKSALGLAPFQSSPSWSAWAVDPCSREVYIPFLWFCILLSPCQQCILICSARRSARALTHTSERYRLGAQRWDVSLTTRGTCITKTNLAVTFLPQSVGDDAQHLTWRGKTTRAGWWVGVGWGCKGGELCPVDRARVTYSTRFDQNLLTRDKKGVESTLTHDPP